jgi:16S rRNA processing protein RimM
LNREETVVRIGEIVSTHGIHGKLRVRYHNEDKKGFLSYKSLLVRNPLGRLEPFEVTEARIHQKLIIVQLRGLDSIDQAERLVGGSVFVERTSLPELEEDEYYWADLIGLEVTTTEGKSVGEVVRIIPTGANDVLVITAGVEELLVPATEEVIKEVDLVSRRMVISLQEGLT